MIEVNMTATGRETVTNRDKDMNEVKARRKQLRWCLEGQVDGESLTRVGRETYQLTDKAWVDGDEEFESTADYVQRLAGEGKLDLTAAHTYRIAPLSHFKS